MEPLITSNMYFILRFTALYTYFASSFVQARIFVTHCSALRVQSFLQGNIRSDKAKANGEVQSDIDAAIVEGRNRSADLIQSLGEVEVLPFC